LSAQSRRTRYDRYYYYYYTCTWHNCFQMRRYPIETNYCKPTYDTPYRILLSRTFNWQRRPVPLHWIINHRLTCGNVIAKRDNAAHQITLMLHVYIRPGSGFYGLWVSTCRTRRGWRTACYIVLRPRNVCTPYHGVNTHTHTHLYT